jgi:hypothetical protein
MSNRDRMMQRWYEDSSFRAAFRANPDAALAEAGIQLSAEERAALGRLGLGDAAVGQRISMGMC